MSEPRDHNEYFGRTTTVFVDLGMFELTLNSMQMEFHCWSSVASFDAGDAPLNFLTRRFDLTESAMNQLREENAEIFTNLTEKLLNIIGLNSGDGWYLEHFKINTTDRQFTIVANKDAAGSRRRIESQSGEEYTKTIAANGELVQGVLGVAWNFGTANDGFLASLTAGE